MRFSFCIYAKKKKKKDENLHNLNTYKQLSYLMMIRMTTAVDGAGSDGINDDAGGRADDEVQLLMIMLTTMSFIMTIVMYGYVNVDDAAPADDFGDKRKCDKLILVELVEGVIYII